MQRFSLDKHIKFENENNILFKFQHKNGLSFYIFKHNRNDISNFDTNFVNFSQTYIN
jgi:hypothetical protein